MPRKGRCTFSRNSFRMDAVIRGSLGPFIYRLRVINLDFLIIIDTRLTLDASTAPAALPFS